MSTTTHKAPTGAWLSAAQAASMLGVSTATLRRWTVAGEVDAFTTPGGHRRYARATIDALLASGTRHLSADGGAEADIAVVEELRRSEVDWLFRKLPELDVVQRERVDEMSRRLVHDLIKERA